MARDYPFYFNNNIDNPEADTLEEIYDEAIALHSYQVYYIVREFAGEIVGFGEFQTKVMKKAIPVRMYIEEIDDFGGPGELFSKFGYVLRESITLYVSKKELERCKIVPKVQDLIFVPVMNNKVFEIQFVDDDSRTGSFYTLGRCFGYKLIANLFNFDYSEICDDISECKHPECLMRTNEERMKQDIEKLERLLDIEIQNYDGIVNELIDENEAPESADEIVDDTEKHKLGLLD